METLEETYRAVLVGKIRADLQTLVYFEREGEKEAVARVTLRIMDMVLDLARRIKLGGDS